MAINNVWRGSGGLKIKLKQVVVKVNCTRAKPTSFVLISDPILNSSLDPRPPHSSPTPLDNFHSPTLPDTGYHWSSSLRWLTCFERLELLVSTLYLQFRWKKKNFCHLCPSWEHKKQTETERRFPRGAALDEPRVVKWTSLLGTARADEK